jgi:hypothetical protein
MLIKTADDQTAFIEDLERAAAVPGPDGKRAATELRNRRAGLRGERDAAYLIDFDFAQSPNWAVLHDLRLEHGGRVAQIDHLLINRWLQVYVLETKHFHAGVKITDDGEFLRWNDFAKRFEGMPSPLAQNDRHIQVLRDVFSTLPMPERLGIRIPPEFMTLVLVSPSARVDRSRKFDSSRVVKADALKAKIWKDIDAEGNLFGMLKTVAKIVSAETVMQIAKALVAKHRPLFRTAADVSNRGDAVASPPRISDSLPAPPMQDVLPSPAASVREPAIPVGPTCKACGGHAGAILYGKYGYYLKCDACAANTSIRFACAPGHEPRLRKDGLRFFRECSACNTSTLYFTNPATAR